MAWIGDTVPYAERQPVLARFLSGQILGLVFGQAAGGILGESIGWHGAFWLVAALYVLATSGLGFELACNARTRGGGSRGRAFAAGFRDVLLTVFIEGFAMFGALVFVASYLHDRFDLSLALSGENRMFASRNTRIPARRQPRRRLPRAGGRRARGALGAAASTAASSPSAASSSRSRSGV
jgi:MFS family permease